MRPAPFDSDIETVAPLRYSDMPWSVPPARL